MIRSNILLISVVVAAVASQPASATDFTFDVPVHVSNMPRLARGYVECFVSAVPVGGDVLAVDNVIGRNRTFFDFTDRGYDGTVTVAIDNSSRRSSSEARSYSCSMFGSVLNDSGNPVSVYAETWRFDYPAVTHINVDRETTRIRANLP